MKKFVLSTLLLFPVFSVLFAADREEPAILPLPVKVEYSKGQFDIKSTLHIGCESSYEADLAVVDLLARSLSESTGCSIQRSDKPTKNTTFRFVLNPLPTRSEDKEGYRLHVSRKEVLVEAASSAGWFYAGQTLLQLLQKDGKGNWFVPAVSIEDHPRFQWRGLMLDVSRHFFSKEVIKSYIDQMAKYKLNTFHWHLTDNQGWRIEIKSLPKLTEVGAWRVPRTGYWKGFQAPQPGEEPTYGGYYSHEDVREIVQYAAQRNVTIVPEVDVPGHSLALIASYPHLSCTKTPQQVLAGDPWNPSRTNVLCAAYDSVYWYLDKVFGEIAELFPGEYIHIGGDEVSRQYWDKCPVCQQAIRDNGLKNAEELQTWFIRKVAAIIESKGKKPMSWYDKLEGGMVDGVAYMSWKDYKGGILASQQGHKAVMTPAFFTYLDFYQGDPAMENGPFTVCRLSSCYRFEPIQEGVNAEHVLGGQGSLWTEQVPNERKLQYMTWPRAMALAEVLWSPKEKRDWDGFIHRMEQHLPRLDADRVKYSTAFYEPIIKAVKDTAGVCIAIDTEVKGLRVYYSFDDCSPDEFYPEYQGQPVLIPKGAHHIRAISYRNGKPVGRELNIPLEGLLKHIK